MYTRLSDHADAGKLMQKYSLTAFSNNISKTKPVIHLKKKKNGNQPFCQNVIFPLSMYDFEVDSCVDFL